jgi:hypothetical protein
MPCGEEDGTVYTTSSPWPFEYSFRIPLTPWRMFTLKSAGKDHPERAYDQAIVRPGDAINVPYLEGQRHRKALLRHEQARMVGQAQLQRVEVRRGLRLQLPVVEAAIAPKLVLELVRISIHRPECQPGQEPDCARDPRLHEIAQVAADLGIKIGTNRLMDGTHPERLGVREQGLILDPRVEHRGWQRTV